MAKFLLALLALFPALASAQTLTKQPDVGTYVPVAATYASGSTPNVLGDGSNAKGGTAPAFTTFPEPTDPTDMSLANWAAAGWIVTDASVCTTNTSSCPEKKFRIQVNSAKFLYDDPIRYYNQPGVSHCHEFFGNKRVNAFSTRNSLRYAPASTAAGGPAWSVAYWEPCWQKTISSKLYAMPSVLNTVYYQRNGTSPMLDDLQHLHLLFRFITGTNMGDPADCGAKNEINLANGGPGTGCNPVVGGPGVDRYTYLGNGFRGYLCTNANGSVQRALKAGYTYAPGFKLNDGTDPWEGRCVAGDIIYAEAVAPFCWDGVNVSSPTGYQHVRHEIGDSLAPGGSTCPNGWFRVPQFELKTAHMTQGWTDYQNWGLASDAMANATCTTLSQTCPTNPGWSFHADWMNGISKNVRDQVFGFCLGIGTNVPHQCDISSSGPTISATTALTTGNAPDGSRSPQVNGSVVVNSNSVADLKLIETTRTATHDMKGM